MIDFRYHIVSIVAVLIALSIGIVLGTGALGGPLLEDLESNLDELRTELRDRRAENAAPQEQLSIDEDFAAAAEPYIVDGALDDQIVVMIDLQGTGGEIEDRLSNTVALSGGSTGTKIELRDRFALDDDIEIEELALSLSSVSGEPEALRLEAAELLGSTLGAAADGRVGSGSTALLQDLEAADFVDIERDGDVEGSPVSEGAAFLIVGGSTDEAPYEIAPFVLALTGALTDEGATVLVAEPFESSWEIVQSIRNDSDARDEVATADSVELVSGRVAATLGLSRALQGEIDHYGRAPGARTLIPQLQPAT
jgi:hypothetical protein